MLTSSKETPVRDLVFHFPYFHTSSFKFLGLHTWLVFFFRFRDGLSKASVELGETVARECHGYAVK